VLRPRTSCATSSMPSRGDKKGHEVDFDLSEVFSQLEALHPRLRAGAERARDEWHPDSVPPTLLASEIAVEMARSAPTDFSDHELLMLCEFVEKALLDESQAVREVIATGFLEALMGEASAGRFDFTRLSAFLGPEARKYCQAWDAFTGTKTPGLS
jgi:hypothetical protein